MFIKKSINKFKIGVIVFGLVLAEKTFAKEMFSEAPDLVEIVSGFLGFLVKIVGLIGIIAFVGAGIIYLTSAGNPEKATIAKKYLTYSIIGVAVATGSLIILLTINALLGG